MEELANTLAAIDSGVRSLGMFISHFTKACDHSRILCDTGGPEAALSLQFFNVPMIEAKRIKRRNIVSGKGHISQAHHYIGLLQSRDICHLSTISIWFSHRLLPMNNELTSNPSPKQHLATKQGTESSLRAEHLR